MSNENGNVINVDFAQRRKQKECVDKRLLRQIPALCEQSDCEAAKRFIVDQLSIAKFPIEQSSAYRIINDICRIEQYGSDRIW